MYREEWIDLIFSAWVKIHELGRESAIFRFFVDADDPFDEIRILSRLFKKGMGFISNSFHAEGHREVKLGQVNSVSRIDFLWAGLDRGVFCFHKIDKEIGGVAKNQ